MSRRAEKSPFIREQLEPSAYWNALLLAALEIKSAQMISKDSLREHGLLQDHTLGIGFL